MSTSTTAVLIVRGVALLLLILGVASVVGPTQSFFVPSGLVTMGETDHLHDNYYQIQFDLLLPSIVQSVAGVLLFFVSRPVGRLLSRGLPHEPKD